MNPSILKAIILGIVVLGIAIYILKSFIKAIIVTVVIVLLFRIGWVYNSNDLKHKILPDNINSEKIENIFSVYDSYVDKRKEHEVIDTEEIDNMIREEMQKKVDEYINK